MICERDEYFISTNKNLLDIPRIYRFITEESYWGKGRTEEVMHKAIANSAICFGLYQKTENGSVQTGFARIISDLATFAYLSDVFILSEHRGQGLGKWLINTICEHRDLCNLKRIALLTRTPEFYEPLSFVILDSSDVRKFMTRTSSHQPQQ